MTKTELITLFKEATQLSEHEAREYIARLGDIMAAELLGGGEVPIPGVGKIVVKQTAARNGRNPRTKEAIIIPAGRKLALNLSKDFKASLN